MTDANITVASVQQYKANVELLMQQQVALIAPYVTTDGYQGKAASHVEQFGSATAQLKTSRNSDTPNLSVSQDKRWVFPLDYEWGTLIDKQDIMRMIIDPKSPLASAGAAAMNRAKDDEIINKFFATNFVGENGTSQETIFSSTTYDISVDTGGTASNINVAKLQKAVQQFIFYNKGEVMEPLYCAISSVEHDSLLKEVQVNNQDFGGSAVLVDGKVKRFMGFDFIITERLATDATNRSVPAWRKSGMHLGTWQDVETKVTERADKSYAWQVYHLMTIGATRLQAGKVFRILCAK